MSDDTDLTRRIEAIVFQIIAGVDDPEAAIASLIADELTDLTGKLGEAHGRILRLQENYAAQKAAAASARREALEEAARWHDERAERTRKTLERGMSLAMRDTLDTVAYHHEQSAAAIRSLVAKEATERQPDEFGHVTRIVDAATHDERCDLCGATDARGDARLTQPCPKAEEADNG